MRPRRQYYPPGKLPDAFCATKHMRWLFKVASKQRLNQYLFLSILPADVSPPITNIAA